jgi:hypothetical protein
MEWFALIIPIISCIVALVWFRDKFAWWEYIIPTFITVMIILLCKLSVKTSLVADKEYWGSIIVEARYYEYWDSWVDRTCSYTTTSCDSKGENCVTTTHYYDCSYCDTNNEHWVAIDDVGNEWYISESYYNFLRNKWKSQPQFKELNRYIDKHGDCGTDGDIYYIRWNGDISSSESAVTKYSYVNRIQASHSSFKLPVISDKEAKKLHLYTYPELYSYYKQKVILGLDSIYNKREVEQIETLFQYFNGYYGARNKVKLFICLFYDKPMSIVYKQKAYWSGGNQNEIVVCIGLNKNKELAWVDGFSWTNQKEILIGCRDDIMELKTFQAVPIYSIIQKYVGDNIVYRDFEKDFSYLKVELPNWALLLIWILTFLFVSGAWIWCFTNEWEQNLN